jgi:hypothetical protein
MAVIRADWIDPEIGESLRGFPDFAFSADNLPAMRNERCSSRSPHPTSSAPS